MPAIGQPTQQSKYPSQSDWPSAEWQNADKTIHV